MDHNDLRDSVFHIEILVLFHECSRLQLGKTQHVLDVEDKLVGGMAADLVTFSDLSVELMHDALGSLVYLATDRVKEFGELVNLILYVLYVVAHDIQWVPHLMRDRRVDQSNELTLTFEGVFR